MKEAHHLPSYSSPEDEDEGYSLWPFPSWIKTLIFQNWDAQIKDIIDKTSLCNTSWDIVRHHFEYLLPRPHDELSHLYLFSSSSLQPLMDPYPRPRPCSWLPLCLCWLPLFFCWIHLHLEYLIYDIFLLLFIFFLSLDWPKKFLHYNGLQIFPLFDDSDNMLKLWIHGSKNLLHDILTSSNFSLFLFRLLVIVIKLWREVIGASSLSYICRASNYPLKVWRCTFLPWSASL